MARRIRKTILGQKLGMSQVFDENGVCFPVTIIEAGPCPVLQVKDEKSDGYRALQLGFGDTTPKRVRKPQREQFKKVGTAPKKFVREVPSFVEGEVAVGDAIDLSHFDGVAKVDITGVSKGRGFQGNVKRWNHHIGPKTHGSKSKRIVGSIGMHQDPGRVLKGKKMPGHLGDEAVKTRNLTVVSVDQEQNLLVVRGAVPGANGGYLYIEESLQ